MSFDGIYTISYNNTGTIISATLGPQSVGLSLLPLEREQSQQKWSIRPIGNLGENVYTIQNSYTGAYVIPQGDSGTFTYGANPFGWLIDHDRLTITTTTLPPRGWITGPTLQTINLAVGDIPTTWQIQLVV